MDKTSGAITYAIDFDLDDVNITVPFTCTVTITDSGGLTGTTQLEIDIHDDNDNPPIFSQTTDYIIYAEPTLTSGKFVGQVNTSFSILKTTKTVDGQTGKIIRQLARFNLKPEIIITCIIINEYRTFKS